MGSKEYDQRKIYENIIVLISILQRNVYDRTNKKICT